MAQVFISYRRDDTWYIAGDLKDKLQEHLGPNSVFFDIDSIPLGVDFREFIADAVGQCDVLLVIIGDKWLGSVDSQGQRRIDDPADFVRIEIESALRRKIPVIPVLVEDATMNSLADLPPSIQDIAFRNATEIRAGSDQLQHIRKLIKGLEGLVKSRIVPPPARLAKEPAAKEKANASTPTNTARGSLASPEDPPHGKSGATETTGLSETQKRSDRGKTAKQTGDSSDLLEVIQRALKGHIDSHVFVGDKIPPGKLENALGAYVPRRVSPEDVLFLYDNTIFGGAKDGLLLTSDEVFWRNSLSSVGEIRYVDIQHVGFRRTNSFFENAKIELNKELVEVNLSDSIPEASAFTNKNTLAEILAGVIRQLSKHVKRNAGVQ